MILKSCVQGFYINSVLSVKGNGFFGEELDSLKAIMTFKSLLTDRIKNKTYLVNNCVMCCFVSMVVLSFQLAPCVLHSTARGYSIC